jgi:hypothetical protein
MLTYADVCSVVPVAEPVAVGVREKLAEAGWEEQVLTLLALLVQKYK